jgi:CheY-like chemotaxis protein
LISVDRLLDSEGFQVATAGSGREALEKAQRETHDLILLDIVMPVMSGYATLETMRRLDAYRKTPIVLLTAKSAEADREKGLRLGATRFLTKPIDPERLLEVIRELCVEE